MPLLNPSPPPTTREAVEPEDSADEGIAPAGEADRLLRKRQSEQDGDSSHTRREQVHSLRRGVRVKLPVF